MLFRAELGRFLSRRSIALLLLAAALFTGVIAAKTIWDTRAPSAAEVATARAQADLVAEQSDVTGEIAECRKDPASYLGPHATAAACRDALVPSAATMLPRERLSLARVFGGDGVRVAVVLVAIVVLCAATFAGADWASDSITTQLTFRPDRAAVWLTKAGAVLLVAGVSTAVLLVAFWGSLWIAADVRGISVADRTLTHAGWQIGRAVLLAMGAGLGSYALTMLFRHTVATLALLFTYAAGGEVLINLIPINGASRWAVGNNVYGWLKNHFQYVDPGVGCHPFSNCDAVRSLGHGDAAWFLGALLVVAVVPSVLSFVRRDV